MQALKPLLLLLLAGTALPLPAGEHRQHGAHEHSIGKLNIAQEGNEIHIEIDSPAANIVGFEHVPGTGVDHDSLEKALNRLKDGASLFLPPQAAGCSLVDSHIDTPLSDRGGGEEKHRAEHAHHTDEPSHRNNEKHAEAPHTHEKGHADITATWRFSCTHPEALDQLGVRVFEAFPGTERLQVQFIIGTHQGAAELSASQPTLRF